MIRTNTFQALSNEEWKGFYRVIKQVFANREPVDVPLKHPIFHCAYDLDEKPQIPGTGVGARGGFEELRTRFQTDYRAV
jgi:hypothetical protein